MEEVVENLNHLCWNVIENSRMNVVPFKSVRCTHELETVEEKEANVFLDVWPPTFSCGCVANAGDGRLSRRARRMPSRAQIEELLKYLEENPPPLSADQTTTNPDPYIERWLQAAERIHESDGEDVPEVAGRHWQALILLGPRCGAGWGALPHAVQRVPGGGTGHYGEAEGDGEERRPPGVCR